MMPGKKWHLAQENNSENASHKTERWCLQQRLNDLSIKNSRPMKDNTNTPKLFKDVLRKAENNEIYIILVIKYINGCM